MSSYPPPPPSGQPGPPPAPPGMYQASDGRFYPVQGAQAMQPPPPPKKGKGGWIALLVVGAVVVLCGGGLALAAIAGNSTKQALDEAASTATTAVPAPGASRTTAAAAATTTGKAATTKPGFGDVAITACAISENPFLGPEASLKITNNSSKPSNYIIEVAFVSKDGAQQYDTGHAAVNGLAPGQVSEQKASSLNSEVRDKAAAGFDCKLLDVLRMAA